MSTLVNGKQEAFSIGNISAELYVRNVTCYVQAEIKEEAE